MRIELVTKSESKFGPRYSVGVGVHVNRTCHKVIIEIWATVGVGKHVN